MGSSFQRDLDLMLGGSMSCLRCEKMHPISEYGRHQSYCKKCRQFLKEYKAGVSHLPKSPDDRIYKAKERLGSKANKNQDLVLAKAAQIAIQEIEDGYKEHPRLTQRAMRRIRNAEVRSPAMRSS